MPSSLGIRTDGDLPVTFGEVRHALTWMLVARPGLGPLPGRLSGAPSVVPVFLLSLRLSHVGLDKGSHFLQPLLHEDAI